ncbi:MAG TPA: hypothetical protein DD417_08975 [Elusimicrobia bacterium]|nr:hypothetical protein [Elusimicrobiota bacterium]
MRGAALSMTILRPRSTAEALRALAETPDALPLSGGTDLMVSWNMGLLNGRRIVDISGLRDWSKISPCPGGLRIGALATHSAIRSHPEVQAHFPLLAEACAGIGALQIQNRGTLGGNIANASPAGDTFPALAVYEAVVRTAFAGGSRTIPFLGIFAGVKKTTLHPGELIESVELTFPQPKPGRRLYRKVGTRAAQAISKTAAAGLLWFAKDRSVAQIRFALGSMAPTVRRLRAAEAFLAGKRLDEPVIREACALLERDVSPIDDIRSTKAYRLRVSQNILRGFLQS